jgi:hypothetical protein
MCGAGRSRHVVKSIGYCGWLDPLIQINKQRSPGGHADVLDAPPLVQDGRTGLTQDVPRPFSCSYRRPWSTISFLPRARDALRDRRL